MFLYFSKFGSQYSITFQIYGYARVTYLRILRFCWDFCKFTFFAMQRLVQSSARYNFFCNCYCYHYFSKNVIPTVVTTFLKNIIATLLAIRFKLSTYLNDWMLKNLCIFSCTPGTTWWKISTTSEWHISLICYYQCLAC